MKFKKYHLKELGEIVGGGTPSTQQEDFYRNGTIPWITPKDLTNYEFKRISRGERNITESGYNNSSTKLLPKNTVLFSSRAPIGLVALADCELCTNQGFKSIIPNSDLIDPDFLYYLMLYNRPAIQSIASGTTFMEVSGKVLGNFMVSIPERIEDQKKVATVLSSLDEQIETKKKINKNLEFYFSR